MLTDYLFNENSNNSKYHIITNQSRLDSDSEKFAKKDKTTCSDAYVENWKRNSALVGNVMIRTKNIDKSSSNLIEKPHSLQMKYFRNFIELNCISEKNAHYF